MTWSDRISVRFLTALPRPRLLAAVARKPAGPDAPDTLRAMTERSEGIEKHGRPGHTPTKEGS